MKRIRETNERNGKMNAPRVKLLALAVGALTGLGLFADARTLWVNGDGAADTPDGSEAAPYATIQAAVDAAAEGDTVKVRPGIYDADEIAGPGGTLARVVIDKALTLESTDGKDRTFVIGQKGNGSDGTGAGAVRCVVICNGAAAVVKGFTLADGHASGRNNDYEASFGGCVLMTGNARDAATEAKHVANAQAFVVDSIVRDGSALRGGNVAGGNLVRCLVANGTAASSGCGSYNANSYLSVYIENGGAVNAGAIYGGTHVSATVQQSAGRFFAGYGVSCFQCVFVGEAVLHHTVETAKPNFQFCVVPKDEVYATEVSTEPQDILASSVNCVLDAAATLAVPTFGDFRHVSAVQSEAARGEMGFNAKIPEAYRTVDFAGNPLVTDKTAPCYAGAIQAEVCAAVPTGESAIVVRAGDFTKGRLCVNGTPVLLDGTCHFDGETVRISGVGNGDCRLAYCTDATGARCFPGADGAITLKPKAGKTPDLTGAFLKPVWADAANGDDATADGTEAKPYRTLQAAYEKAAASDETCRFVLAKPGDYDTGGAVPAGSSLSNRLCMTQGNVLVRSTAGRDVTFITGASSTERPDKFGNGPCAVRCLYLKSGWVQGFTLRGGRTFKEDVQDVDHQGGGVYVGPGSTVNLAATAPGLRDCTVTNCSAVRVSAAYGGNYDNCLLLDNDVVKGVRVRYAGYLRQCFLAGGNDAGTYIQDCNTLESCTVVAPLHYALVSCARVVNSVIHRPTRTDIPSWAQGCSAFRIATKNLAMTLENCAIDPNETCEIAESATGSTFTKTACRETLTNDDFGEGSRPCVTSAYVDADDAAFVDLWDGPWENLADALGNPRVSNGARDLGGIELDWRAVYAARLGRGVTVTAAPASATAVADGVKLVGGDLVLGWVRPGAKARQITVEVTGNGRLRVQVNGTAVGEYGAGLQAITFESATGSDTVTLTYVPGDGDTGGAVVRTCRRGQGVLFVLR